MDDEVGRTTATGRALTMRSGEAVRALRGEATGEVFGRRVRAAVATILDVPVESVPEVSYTQVSRWEARGLDPSTRKLPTLLYLAAMRRMVESD